MFLLFFHRIVGIIRFINGANTKSKLDKFDCFVLIQDDNTYDIDFIKEHAKIFVDARDHKFNREWTNDDIITTREMRSQNRESGDEKAVQNVNVVATYSGIVPIVYKAQRSLLKSLIDSICLAFVMIAFVMMLLLRDWKQKMSAGIWVLGMGIKDSPAPISGN